MKSTLDALRFMLSATLTQNIFRLQIFMFVVITSLLIKEVFRSGFRIEMPIKDLLVWLWLVFVYIFNLSGKVSIIAALILVSVIPFFMLFGASRLADQGSVIAYLVLLLGIFKILKEETEFNGSNEV